jgi:hypothetical protein
VKLDFARQDAPDGSTYSGAVSAGICEACGHIELSSRADVGHSAGDKFESLTLRP